MGVVLIFVTTDGTCDWSAINVKSTNHWLILLLNTPMMMTAGGDRVCHTLIQW